MSFNEKSILKSEEMFKNNLLLTGTMCEKLLNYYATNKILYYLT